MIQPFFDYACSAWYPNINKKLKTRLQAAQNKCIRFCLKLDDRFRLKSKEFERINWLPVQERISQCAVCNVYKFFSKHSPDYFEELFFPTEETAIRTHFSFQKLKIPRRKTNIGLKSLSYTGPSLWNNLNENLKRSSSINDFKHKTKEFYFEELKKKTCILIKDRKIRISSLKSFPYLLFNIPYILFSRDHNENKAFKALFCVIPVITSQLVFNFFN